MSSLITSPGSSSPLSAENQLKKLGGSSNILLLPIPSASADGRTVKSYSSKVITAVVHMINTHLSLLPDYLCVCHSCLPRTLHHYLFRQHLILKIRICTKMLQEMILNDTGSF